MNVQALYTIEKVWRGEARITINEDRLDLGLVQPLVSNTRYYSLNNFHRICNWLPLHKINQGRRPV